MKKEIIHEIKLSMDPDECKKLVRILQAAYQEDLNGLQILKKEILDFKEILEEMG